VKDEVESGKPLDEVLRQGDELMKTKKTLSTVHTHLKKAGSFRLIRQVPIPHLPIPQVPINLQYTPGVSNNLEMQSL
jgi:hypothetical protein